jgi:hypothetical protein
LPLGDGAEPGAIRDRDQNASTVPSDTVIGLSECLPAAAGRDRSGLIVVSMSQE